MWGFWSQRNLASNPGSAPSVYMWHWIIPLTVLNLASLLTADTTLRGPTCAVVVKGLNEQMDVHWWAPCLRRWDTGNGVNYCYWLHDGKNHCGSSRPAFQRCCAFSSCSVLTHWCVGCGTPCQQVGFPRLQIYSRCLRPATVSCAIKPQERIISTVPIRFYL